MKYIKKAASTLMLTVAAAVLLSACGKPDSKPDSKPPEADAETEAAADSFGIVCSIFPQYDFVTQILGDNPAGAEVTYLLGSGVDIHNYQASAEDMIKIRTSDLFLYVGGESDQWVGAIVQQADKENLHLLALIDMVETQEERIVEGMEHEHKHADHDHESEDHDHEDHDHESEDHDHEGTPDEHVWLSLKKAIMIVNGLCDEITAIDPVNAAYYKENADAYVEQLEALDSQYEEVTGSAARNTILVADRFPFRYLADDYSLEYFAAFPGCAAETEASFETVVFLAEKVKEKQLPIILVIDGSDGKIAQTVIANASGQNAEVKMLNSIQSVSRDEMKSGVTYLGIMEENLGVLKEALN